MESSSYMGMMAVVAVSGSVALVALQLHKRLMVDFLKKVQLEMGHGDDQGVKSTLQLKNERVKLEKKKNNNKKKVRFAADVVEPSSNNKEYRMRRSSSLAA